jgi:hypothetical protein
MIRTLIAVAVVSLIALYLRSLAGRLDRLHVRAEGARDALDAQLIRRSAAAVELAYSGLLDPATSVLLAQEALLAQAATEPDRASAESELTGALHAAFADDATVDLLESSVRGKELTEVLRSACHRVMLARRFANEAVRTTQALRERRLVRWLRLAGTAPYPREFEMDDLPPASLGVAA